MENNFSQQLTIITKILTLEEKSRVLRALDLVVAEIFKNNGNYLKVLEENLPFGLAEILSHDLQRYVVGGPVQSENMLLALKKEVSDLPVISLTLPFPPEKETVERIHAWFLSERGQCVVFDFNVKPEVIAGAVLEANGYLRDYSVKNMFKNYFERRSA